MSEPLEVNNFGMRRGWAYIVLQSGFNNPHLGDWEISFSFNKKKYYFKSFRSAELFLEINAKAIGKLKK